MTLFLTVQATIIAYLFGSISTAVIVCRLMGLADPREQGSKNPGATNVLRIGGKKAAVLTLLGDMLKGVIPVLFAKAMGLPPICLGIVAFAAFFGHLYPIFFGFVGGKGVATAIGCTLALSLPTGIAWLITWAAFAFIWRYSSLASLIAALLAPFYAWWFTHEKAYFITLALMAVFLYYRHRENIRRIFSGEESKIGSNSR